jgi:uncharacterized protein (TIRG00374 family)
MRSSVAAWLRIGVGLVVSAIFLVLLLRQVDGGELVDSLREVEPVPLALAAPVYALALWVRALRWRMLLRPHTEIGAGETASVMTIGLAANNLLPARAGELVRVVLLNQRHGVDRLAALGTIAVERAVDGVLLAFLLGFTLLVGGAGGAVGALAIAMTVVFATVGLLLAELIRRPQVWSGRIAVLLRLAPQQLRPRLHDLLDRFLAGVTALRGRRVWSAVIVLSTATWLGEAATYALVGAAFGLGLDWWHYVAVAAAANLAIVAPATAGGVGPFEYFAREVAVVFGAGAGIGTAYALALHAYILIPVSAVGLLLLWARHIGLGTLRRQSLAPPDPNAATPTVEPPASRGT